MEEGLYTYLASFISENKRGLFEQIIKERTRHITVVVEDIFQPHNASAVLRSCDCFGVQDVHIIENYNEYNVNPDVALGASKWLNIHKYNTLKNNTADCFEQLKSMGYKVFATSPHKGGFTPDDIPIDQPVALAFGTEKEGLSDIALSNADGYLQIPMYGFTESFNISVSAALVLYRIMTRLRASDHAWKLSEKEIMEVKLDWVRKVLKRADLLEADYQQNK